MLHGLSPDQDLLQRRATLLGRLRAFMAERDILEVMTPLLRPVACPDAHIDLFSVDVDQTSWFLQSSPELAMKILLSWHQRDIYQLSPVFRDEPFLGPYHAREFLLLEWYRIGWDYLQLAKEVVALLQLIVPNVDRHFASWHQLMQEALNHDPRCLSDAALTELTRQKTGIDDPLDRQTCYERLFDSCVLPCWQQDILVVYDFPLEMAALATIDAASQTARRFECYLNGHELANGFAELGDAKEQRLRFQAQNAERLAMGKSSISLDERFLTELSLMPPCSGVAVGVDRLLTLF